MTYEERITIIKEELATLLSEYAPPKHLEDPAAQAKSVDTAARMLNQMFPNDTTDDHIRGVIDRASLRIKQTHKTNSWPKSADIAAAVKGGISAEIRPTSIRTTSHLEANALRMKANEPVGDGYIFGRNAVEMLEQNLITEELRQHYRKGYMRSLEDVYGHETAASMIRRLDYKHGVVLNG